VAAAPWRLPLGLEPLRQYPLSFFQTPMTLPLVFLKFSAETSVAVIVYAWLSV
jgi:hypothetical protein